MADEPNATPAPTTPEAAGFNEDALRSQVSGAVREALTQMGQQVQQRQAEQEAQRRAQETATRQSSDPIYTEVVQKYVEPHLQRMNLQTQAAVDLSNFYALHPDAGTMREKIEPAFNQLLQQGRPTERESIYKYLVGEEALRAQQTQQRTAQNATVGAAGIGRAQGNINDNFENLSLEDKRKRLEGVSF